MMMQIMTEVVEFNSTLHTWDLHETKGYNVTLNDVGVPTKPTNFRDIRPTPFKLAR